MDEVEPALGFASLASVLIATHPEEAARIMEGAAVPVIAAVLG